MKKKLCLILVLTFPHLMLAQQKTDAGIKLDIVKLINPENMIEQIRDFSSPAFEGRELGTLGNTKATDWIKYSFIDNGLTALHFFPNYESSFTVKNYKLEEGNALKIGVLNLTNPVISPAVWGSSAKIKGELTTNLSKVAGKVALIAIDSSDSFTAQTFEKLYRQSFEIQKLGAIGIVFYWHSDFNDGVNMYRYDDFVEIPLLAEKNIINTSRPYVYLEQVPIPIVFTNPKIGVQLNEIQGLQIDLSTQFSVEFSREAKNVLAYFPGKLDRLDKAIIITASLDQEGVNAVNGNPYLGANSNGSGIVTMIELAKAIKAMKTKPLYPIVFIALNGSRRLNAGIHSLFQNDDFNGYFKNNTWIELESTAYTYTEEDLSHVNISVTSRLNYLRKMPFGVTKRPKIEADIDTLAQSKSLHPFISNHIHITSDPSPYSNRVVDAQNKMNYVTFYRIAEISADLVWRLANYNE